MCTCTCVKTEDTRISIKPNSGSVKRGKDVIFSATFAEEETRKKKNEREEK